MDVAARWAAGSAEYSVQQSTRTGPGLCGCGSLGSLCVTLPSGTVRAPLQYTAGSGGGNGKAM